MYVSLILKQGVRLLTPGFCDLDLAMAAPGVALEVCGRAGTAPGGLAEPYGAGAYRRSDPPSIHSPCGATSKDEIRRML
jgi:hypothetical protein|eukprot:COSAG01_NODE_15248_length_1357_cov_15.107313_2_plen_79_part_00